MDILNTALKSAKEAPFSIAVVQFSSLLSEWTPIQVVPISNVDFQKISDRENILSTILKNYGGDRIKLSVACWSIVLEDILSLMNEFERKAITAETFNMKISLCLIASRLDGGTVWKTIGLLKDITAVPFACPNFVDDFLRSDLVQIAFQIPPYKQGAYLLPPRIYLTDGLVDASVRGWVMMNNSICIHASRAAYLTACSKLDLCTLVLHESKHGAIRAVLGDFNVHSPDIEAIPLDADAIEAGRAVERAVWKFWPRWYAPQFPEAENLAQRILDSLEAYGQFETPDDLDFYVGDRSGATTAMDAVTTVYWD